MHVLANSLSWPDKVGLIVTLIGVTGGAVASCLAAWRTGKTHTAMQPPSNGVTPGAVGENTNVAVRQLGYLVADFLKQHLDLPTPRETQNLKPGSTLNDPPAPPSPEAPPSPPPAAPSPT